MINGDFNEIMSNKKKLGGCPRSEQQLSLFRDTIAHLGLRDSGFFGYPYTWHRGNGAPGGIEECLGQALASIDWLFKFSNYQVQHLPFILPNHAPFLITFDEYNQFLK